MRITTVKILQLLESVTPGQVFEVEMASGPNKDDRIRLDQANWLHIDAHDDPPMVSLMDERHEVGGQITFWMIKCPSDISEVVQTALKFSAEMQAAQVSPKPA